MSSCFRCTVGYPSFRIQTIISVIYSTKDLFLLPIKCGFDGSKTSDHDKTRLFNRSSSISFTTISAGNVLFSPKQEKLLLQTFRHISAMFSVGEIWRKEDKKKIISFDPPKVLLSILEFVLYWQTNVYLWVSDSTTNTINWTPDWQFTKTKKLV